MQPEYICYVASFFMLLRRFLEQCANVFYLYPSSTCGFPGGTPSVTSLPLKANF